MLNLAVINNNTAISRFFRFSKWRLSAIFDFQKFEFLTVDGADRANMRVSVPNFVAISQTIAEIWWFSIFSNMASVRHPGFVVRVFGPSIKGFHLVVFITVQNFVGIDEVVSITCKF